MSSAMDSMAEGLMQRWLSEERRSCDSLAVMIAMMNAPDL